MKSQPQPSQINQALQVEIQAFCDESRLTPREAEVVFVLAEGVVRIKDVAERLNLSPNTVNNHVNSIFAKTKARSKSELLAVLLGRIASDLRSAKMFRRRPKTLLLSSDDSFVASVSPFFTGNGFLVHTLPGRTDVLEIQAQMSSADFSPNFIIVDGDSAVMPKNKWIQWAAENYSAMVVFVSSQSTMEERSEAMHLGAVDCLTKPLDLEIMLKVFLCHFIEDEAVRQTFLDCKSYPALPCRDAFEVNYSNAGRGGFFISSKDIERIYGSTPEVGQMIDLKLLWGFGPRKRSTRLTIPARGQVVWSKGQEGAGVRLLSAGDPDLRSEMVSLLNEKSVRSYIPINYQN